MLPLPLLGRGALRSLQVELVFNYMILCDIS